MKQNLIYQVIIFLNIFLSLTLKSHSQNNAIIISIAGISNGDISKEAISNNPYIKCSEKDLKIIEFSIFFDDLSGKQIEYKEKGNKLSNLILKEIQTLYLGEQIDVKVLALNQIDGKTYDLFMNLRIISVKPDKIEPGLND